MHGHWPSMSLALASIYSSKDVGLQWPLCRMDKSQQSRIFISLGNQRDMDALPLVLAMHGSYVMHGNLSLFPVSSLCM